MEKIKQLLGQLQGKIDALSLREWAILFTTISIILYIIIDFLLLTPLKLEHQGVMLQIQTVQSETNQFAAQALSIIERAKIDPNLTEHQQLDRLNQELDNANRNIEKAVEGLITPERMAIALESLLQKQKGLKFISIENQPAKPLIDTLTNATDQGASATSVPIPAQGIYQHSFKLQFEGSYLDTLAYLQELEGLEWRFRWDEINLTMLEYPAVHVTIILHTMSLDEGVIGV